MAMMWRKPPEMKYTDMCIWIDQNMEKLREPGKYPEIEETIYNYLWLLVKALAIKKCMFTKFEEYDGYAFYAANRLFFAIRKNLENQGHVVKGKLIRPIKSCLNYTKALLYPMKIEYQREAYREIIEEEYISTHFDSFTYKEHLKNSAKLAHDVSGNFRRYLVDSLSRPDYLLDKVLRNAAFKPGTDEYFNLKKSILLTSISILKDKHKLEVGANSTAVLWHLPKNMSSYVKILTKEFFTEIKKEVMDCYRQVDMSDSILEAVLASGKGEPSYEGKSKTES